MTLGHAMKHWGCKVYQVCSNDYHRLKLTYEMSRSNFASLCIKMEILRKVDFSKTVEALVIILT